MCIVGCLLHELSFSCLFEFCFIVRSECDQTVEATRTEMQESCIKEKEKIQEEMNSQLAAMKKQLKIQYQETEHLDQMLQQQQQKQPPGDGNGGDKAQLSNIPEQQSPQVLQREVQASQLGQTSHLANQFERGRILSDREHPGGKRNSTYHSRGSRSRNFQRGRGSLHRGQPEPVRNDGTVRLTQAALGRISDERSSSILDRVSVNGYQQKLTKESENEGIQPKEPQGETAGEQAKPIPETMPEDGNSHSDQNAGVADEKSLK